MSALSPHLPSGHSPIAAVGIGCSAGGLDALRHILPGLPAGLPVPVVVVAHMGPSPDNPVLEAIGRHSGLPVVEAKERGKAVAGFVHVCPPDYHLLVEADHGFALSVDPKVNNSRPSIDVFLCAAAESWGSGLLAVLLTGASGDGAAGMAAVKAAGGLCIVQDPAGAHAPTMPRSAIDAGGADWVAPLDEIAGLIVSLCPPPRLEATS
ncbi:chemotaxis protein CheB [Magnetospirillum sp. SS-4]|uniref:chemotaxis protein CheB n=1 Tax=Magnetospirillum sp. SS-4 TaxID=2681465 RepID=UPI0013846B78|nr:chemotaxis protein CheB [Magnetospirillum sp. SS-4]CAA7614411.1 putative chemotaxis protein-glutamate methylesterase [Magnetospirillum sp. SS-4]